MSPITIVCLPARVNAAHAPRPIGGVIRTPPAVALMSPRGSVTLNTPSFASSAPFAPVASSIAAVSSAAAGFSAPAAAPASARNTPATAGSVDSVDRKPVAVLMRDRLHPPRSVGGADLEQVDAVDVLGVLQVPGTAGRLRRRLVVAKLGGVAQRHPLRLVRSRRRTHPHPDP